MTILFALLTSLTNALAVTLQHIASTSDTEKSSGWKFVVYLMRHPLWLLGWLALCGSLIFQALALHFGPLSLVQPILVTELIIALVLRQLWLRQSIRAVTWVAAVLTGAGLVVFLVTTSPHGASFLPTSSSWTVPSIVCVAGVAMLVALAQRGSPARRAALFASATAIVWALEATFIKATTDTISALGFGGAFTRWPVYALIAGGIIGLLCEQAALHVGPLSVSQTFIVIVDPIVSVALGVWLYHERLNHDALHLTVGVIAFAVMCAGIVALTRTAPATMTADVHRV
ncbi:MAG: DMT family transporter [Acidimicrobiales bacterium]|jgi:drug/metabolite transporter (DMT)-like permease